MRLPLTWFTRSHRLIRVELYVNIAQYKLLFPNNWTLTVAYGCVTFIAAFENIAAVRRRPLTAQPGEHASRALIGWERPCDRLSPTERSPSAG